MKSAEQINKIEAVMLYILQHFKNGVDYIKLFKIIYSAQREYLATYGLTIAEDTFKARQLGPVPSLTYKVVKMAENGDKTKDLKGFTSAIRVDEEQKVYAVEKPDMDYIADMEREELHARQISPIFHIKVKQKPSNCISKPFPRIPPLLISSKIQRASGAYMELF